MDNIIELPWADAPDWAIAAAMDEDKRWYWCGVRRSGGYWNPSDGPITPNPPPAPDWRESLQLRPVDAAPELPEGVPPLPDGWEYVGVGTAMERGKECMYCAWRVWRGPSSCEQVNGVHYARRKPSAEQSESIPCEIGEVGAASNEFLLELADRGYRFLIEEDGITAWMEDGDVDQV